MTTSAILLTSAMAMNSHSHSLGQIGTNVSNVNTVGYKKQESMFHTLLSSGVGTSANGRENIFSVAPTDRRYVTSAGTLQTTGRRDDIAISGKGLFMLSPSFGDFGKENDLLYSRAGDFLTAKVGEDSYLVNSQGAHVMGWNYDIKTGNFSNVVEPVKTTLLNEIAGFETKNVAIRGNLQALGGNTSPYEKMSFTAYDGKYGSHVVTLQFKPTSANNWELAISADGGTATSEVKNVEFNSDATIKSPAEAFTTTITWNDGTVSNINIDLSKVEQFATETAIYNTTNDGAPSGDLADSYWDKNGVLQAVYTNARTVPICKLALADFTAPNMLEAVSGTMFRRTTEAGDKQILDLEKMSSKYATISGETLEASNVTIEQEFTGMITTQKAYTSASKVFQTGDEMYKEAIGILA